MRDEIIDKWINNVVQFAAAMFVGLCAGGFVGLLVILSGWEVMAILAGLVVIIFLFLVSLVIIEEAD